MTLLEEIPREPYREGSIPVLETKRLALRAARLEDAKAVAALANDRRIAENTARIPYPYKVADAEKFIGGANKNGEAAFLITLRDKTIIGACGIMFHYDDTPELGYWLGVPFWNQGYATEALRAGEVRIPVDRRRALPDQLDQIVGSDRSIPAGARDLVGAQDLGPRKKSDVSAPPASTETMRCISRHTSARTGSRFSTRSSARSPSACW